MKLSLNCKKPGEMVVIAVADSDHHNICDQNCKKGLIAFPYS